MGSIGQQIATRYLSGLADGEYRCLNSFSIIFFLHDTSTPNTKRNKGGGGGGGGPVRGYSRVRPQNRREQQKVKLEGWKFREQPEA